MGPDELKLANLLAGDHEPLDLRGALPDLEHLRVPHPLLRGLVPHVPRPRSEEHTSELQSPYDLVCRLLLEKKKKNKQFTTIIKYKKRTSHTKLHSIHTSEPQQQPHTFTTY